MKIFEFAYNDCTYESSWACISLHETKEGAEKALKEHKAKELKENGKIQEWQDWVIWEREVLE